MSLDTILQIGKILRRSENNLKYYKYVQPCSKDRDGNWPICITIPVNTDFSFDWNNIYITPENQREKLYYLNYFTSDNDSSPKKYLFGDICYTRKSEIDKTGKIKGIKDYGNFTFEKGKRNAFLNGQKVYEEIITDYFVRLIKSDLLKVVSEKDVGAVLKFILSSYKNDKPIDIPNRISKYDQAIDAARERLKHIGQENDLIQFHHAFELEIEKFNLLLLYAPVFEANINDKEVVQNSLKSLIEVKENYLDVIKNNNQTVLKRLFGKGESFDSYSEESKNKLLQYADFTVFIHFEYFKNGKKLNWHQFEEVFDIIKNKLYSNTTKLANKRIVPTKSIYRTLCSGNDKNDIQFPSFKLPESYKSFSFKDEEQFEDFLYTGSILNKSFRQLKFTEIDMFIYPVALEGEEISSADYEEFFFDKKDETRLNYDPIFSIFDNEGTKRFNRFDFVFANNRGKTIIDLIELSGLEKSTLRIVQSRIDRIAKKITLERKTELGIVNEFNKIQIEISFRNILGNKFVNKYGRIVFKPSEKYKSHLLKVLPLIYTFNYYNDDSLLPSFIQTSEFIIRNIEKKFIRHNYSNLKYHLKFLLKIQNTKNDRFMKITSSESYQIGFILGGMAKNLSLEINSFEKNYVGNLTRRIGTLPDFIKFKNEIEQKLIMHDKAKFTFQKSYDLAQKVKEFKTKYDKEECAFGFMESYFKPLPKKETATSDERQI